MRVAEQLEKQDSLRRQVRSAMAYPMMIGIFSLVVLLALVAFLIPVFEDVFKELQGGEAAVRHADHRRRLALRHRPLVRADRRHDRHHLPDQEVEEERDGHRASGTPSS